MTQTHDLMIDGAGYMIVPGSYRYESKGADLSPVRTGVPAFDARWGRAATLPSGADRDAVRWQAVGMLAAPVGLGDEGGRLILAPKEQQAALGAAFATTDRVAIFNGAVYLSQGANLYKIATAGGAYSALTLVGAAAGTITGLCVSGGLLYIACPNAATMSNYSGSGAIANSPAAVAQTVWDYARGLWRSKKNAVTGEWSVASGSFDGGATWTDFQLDSAIRSACVWHGRATGGGVSLVGTAGMLWELAGQWTGSPATFGGTVSQLFDGRGGGGVDDFAWLVEYEGYAYTWYAGTVMRWNGARLEPIAGGPRGQVLGMASAGGNLCISVADVGAGQYGLWCYDGVRWCMIGRGGTPWATLGGTAGLVSDGHLIALNVAASLSRWAFPVGTFSAAPAASGQVIAGPLDAGQGDTVKTWTTITVPWSTALFATQSSAPANPGGSLLIEYSVDDGSTYVSLGATTIAAGARAGLAQVAIPTGGVEAQRLLVRVTWTPTTAYAAFQLDGVFASGWRVADRPKEERWTAAITVSDKLIRRDGSVDPRTGETMLQALRALAQAGRTFVFQDLDFDLAARTVTCRLVGLAETTRKGDGTRFLETTVTLTLAAVG